MVRIAHRLERDRGHSQHQAGSEIGSLVSSVVASVLPEHGDGTRTHPPEDVRQIFVVFRSARRDSRLFDAEFVTASSAMRLGADSKYKSGGLIISLTSFVVGSCLRQDRRQVLR